MTLKNPKAKGSRNERRSRDLLECMGYKVTKAGGSLGVWDLVGISSNYVVLCQVKSNRWPSHEEMRTMKDFRIPIGYVVKYVHRWDDRASEPRVREIK